MAGSEGARVSLRCSPFLLLLLGVLAGGCAGPATRVVLLPQADGSPSAVVVRATGESVSHMLSAPYQRAIVERGEVRVSGADPDAARRTRADNPALFDLAPPPPQYYVVYFNHGDSTPTEGFQQALNAALVSALARSGGEIVVIGHTDTTGSRTVNDKLAQRRAWLVRTLLVERGFPSSRVEIVARGERELAIRTGDPVHELRNRRVTIVVR